MPPKPKASAKAKPKPGLQKNDSYEEIFAKKGTVVAMRSPANDFWLGVIQETVYSTDSKTRKIKVRWYDTNTNPCRLLRTSDPQEIQSSTLS